MTDNMDDSNSQNIRVAPVHQHRRMGESAMKKVVILGGSIILCLLFLLIIIVNIVDKEWDTLEKLISVSISVVGFIIFASVIVGYIVFHIRKGRQAEIENITTDQRDIEDIPPSYEEIMGKLPSYDSYSKSTAKNVNPNQASLYICHV